jgi:hypothetical protein
VKDHFKNYSSPTRKKITKSKKNATKLTPKEKEESEKKKDYCKENRVFNLD